MEKIDGRELVYKDGGKYGHIFKWHGRMVFVTNQDSENIQVFGLDDIKYIKQELETINPDDFKEHAGGV